MSSNQRILASNLGEAGRPVRKPRGLEDADSDLFSLPADKAEELEDALDAIDAAQQDALAAAHHRYLGSRR